ncbi:hypothetical protein Acid345_1357 [Candidatus Koribacter versatilis Ellin345]|uniref:Uncharacterized protein n=1 Tax=Koribacter versatilis (strain Ellin345) TaxID=204669 RepID=Q1IRZ1_KORVE|nr:hypothetical protein [Candidatus Koribacter versatilis]ABF40359.1 hypothetical protein Acid345_1357 [Candidatus Koribacter versatilis Ellin345]
MAHLHRNAHDQALIQLIEADVDIGFSLVDEVRAYRLSGQPEFSVRAFQNAIEIVADIERRLQHLGGSGAEAFLPLLGELRDELAAVEREDR